MAFSFATRFKHEPDPGKKFDPSRDMARQEFAEECDIHSILKKFKVTGVLVDPTIGNLRRPMFEDFSNLPTLEQFEELKKSMVDSFESLPKQVQDKFGDPLIAANFFGRASNGDILKLWRDCGLNPAEPVQETVEKPVETPKIEVTEPKG